MRNNQREEINQAKKKVDKISVVWARGSMPYKMCFDCFFNNEKSPIKKAKKTIKFKNDGETYLHIGTTGADSLFEAMLNGDLSNTVSSLKDSFGPLHIPENALAVVGPFSKQIYNDKNGFAYVSLSSIDGVFYRISKI
jgi:hypothetical protein